MRLVDERLTTVSAHRALRASGRPGRRHRQVVDQAAAVVILQSAIDAERTAGTGGRGHRASTRGAEIGRGVRGHRTGQAWKGQTRWTAPPARRNGRPRCERPLPGRDRPTGLTGLQQQPVRPPGRTSRARPQAPSSASPEPDRSGDRPARAGRWRLRGRQWGIPLFNSLGAGGEEAADDYPGPGATAMVDLVIPAGATGADMALILYQADVVASTRAFTRAFAANPDASSIQPGTYRLVLQMRASDAVAALLNPESKVQTRVTIAEGLRFDQILEKLTSVTAVPLADFQAAMADPAAVGLPGGSRRELRGLAVPLDVHVRAGYRPCPDDHDDDREDRRRPGRAGRRTGRPDARADHRLARRARVARSRGEPDDGAGDPEPPRHRHEARHRRVGRLRAEQVRHGADLRRPRGPEQPVQHLRTPGCHRVRSPHRARRRSTRCSIRPTVRGSSG